MYPHSSLPDAGVLVSITTYDIPWPLASGSFQKKWQPFCGVPKQGFETVGMCNGDSSLWKHPQGLQSQRGLCLHHLQQLHHFLLILSVLPPASFAAVPRGALHIRRKALSIRGKGYGSHLKFDGRYAQGCVPACTHLLIPLHSTHPPATSHASALSGRASVGSSNLMSMCRATFCSIGSYCRANRLRRPVAVNSGCPKLGRRLSEQRPFQQKTSSFDCGMLHPDL